MGKWNWWLPDWLHRSARGRLREQPRAGGRARRRRAAARHHLARLQVRPLDAATWPDFARLVERHNGVWGGCWCMGFHAEGVGRTKTPGQNRSEKECRVREGRAHAALVVRRCDLRGLVPVRRARRAAADQAPARVPRRSRRPAGLADHRLLRRSPRAGARGSPPPRSRARCGRSRGSAAARWRAIPRTAKAGRSPHRSCTTARWRCSSAMASSAPVAWASTTGWSSRGRALKRALSPRSRCAPASPSACPDRRPDRSGSA